MPKLHFVVSLMTDQNTYQQDQAAAAKEAANRVGATVQVFYSNNDAVTQSQQLLKIIQSSSSDSKPDGIVCHPVGTALERVAQEAMGRGIGWALLNRETEYISDLRRAYPAIPAFCIGLDQEEIGRIQGHQFKALIPNGGLVLYILGPSTNPVFKLRHAGMLETKPTNVQIITLRGNLTEQSGYDAVNSWLGLNTSRTAPVSLIAGQNDEMAKGARHALEDAFQGQERERWMKLPYTGCDASSLAGKEWIRQGMLAASVFLPPTAGLAVEAFARAIQSKTQPPLRQQIAPRSFPVLEHLDEYSTAKQTSRA